MSVSRFAAASGVSALVLASLIAATPASATTIDVSGVEFNFANPGNEDILANSEDGDAHFYAGVAEVDGQTIDAWVRLIDVADVSIGVADFVYFGDYSFPTLTQLNEVNGDDLTEGCYTNEAFASDPYSYDYTLFAPSDDADLGRVTAIDEYVGDETDSAINNDLTFCTEEDVAGTIQVQIDFEVDGEPVTLNNLTLNVTDIDSGQHVTFSSPAPSSYVLGEDSVVEVTEDPDFITFFGEQSSDDDVDPLSMYAADITYDSTSTLIYEFGYTEDSPGYGGSLLVAFSSFFADDLASTGVDATPTGFAGLAALVAGGAIVIARRVRRRA